MLLHLGVGCRVRNCWSSGTQHIRVPEFMRKIAERGGIQVHQHGYEILIRHPQKDSLAKHTYQAKGKFVRLSNLKNI